MIVEFVFKALYKTKFQPLDHIKYGVTIRLTKINVVIKKIIRPLLKHEGFLLRAMCARE